MIKQILGKLPRKPSSKSSPPNSDAPNADADASASAAKGSGAAAGAKNKASAANKLSQGKKSAPPPPPNGPSSSAAAAYDPLPSFRDVPSSEKPALFLRKLHLCCVVFDFSDPTKNAKEKDVKRQTLLELVDYMGSASSKFGEVAMQEITRMVAANIFRTFPSSASHDRKVVDNFDAEEEEPAMEPAWSHLQVVYEFFLRFIASSETDAKLAKRYIKLKNSTSFLTNRHYTGTA